MAGEEEDLRELVDEIIETYREATLSFLDGLDDEAAAAVTQALFEGISHEVGNVEGMAILMGAAREDRKQVQIKRRREGLEEALANHDEGPCDGCQASADLRHELFAN